MIAQSPPAQVADEQALDELLTRPRPELVEYIKTLSGPLLVLGAGGKMGPSLAVLARRAALEAGHKLEIIAASRFSEATTSEWLKDQGMSTISSDLFEREALRNLPKAPNIIYLVGLKFGTAQNPSQTWAANTLIPAHVAEHFASSRIVALSTGNVYPLSQVAHGGSTERASLTPLGEYANAAVARERIFEYFSRRNGTKIVLLRLFYATELRYGVLCDIADKIWAGQPVPLANGWFNCIWQGDANEMIIRSLALAASPATTFNLTSPEPLRVRSVALKLGELLRKEVNFEGTESETALIGNASKLCTLLGPPATPLAVMLQTVADWVKKGGRSLGKPTHFETRDGKY